MAPANTFLYFAYGSNLLAKRIHLFNPSAVRYCIAKLKDYRLDFGYYSNLWKGMVATIVPDEGEHVWGMVWQLNIEDMKNLDKQEGVERNIYKAIDVDAETVDGTRVLCHCYELVKQPPKIPEGTPVPNDRKPSYSYWNVIVEGAIESHLPDDYIEKLRKIEHNDTEADTEKIFSGEIMTNCMDKQ